MSGRRFAVAIALSILMLGLAAPAVAQDAGETLGVSSSVKKALDYLKSRQQSDGGFAEPRGSSSDELTAWVIAGVKSAGVDPASWRKSGKSPINYLEAHAKGWTKLTDLEKACLAVSCAGADPRSFGGRNLVAEIKSHAAADGHIGGMVNEHCWGIIALAAAGEPLPAGARGWLVARQNIDGGYGFSSDSGSDPDDSGAALQALIAVGEDTKSNPVSRVISYLHFCQAPDGGFSFQTDESNVGSTAWAVQGMVAAGENPRADAWKSGGKTPIDYLSGMQQSDGHFRFCKSNDTNLVWMTAETIPALMGKAYPLKADTPAPKTPGPTTTTTTETTTTTAQTDQDSDQGAQSGQVATAPDGVVTTAPSSAPEKSKGNSAGPRAGTSRTSPKGTAQALALGAGRGSGGTWKGIALLAVFCFMLLVLAGIAYAVVRIFRSRSNPTA
jgi:iron complex transport system substrate-binding protein